MSLRQLHPHSRHTSTAQTRLVRKESRPALPSAVTAVQPEGDIGEPGGRPLSSDRHRHFQSPTSWRWVLWPSSPGFPKCVRASHSSISGVAQRWA